MPVLAKLADQYAGAFHLVKVNSDEQQALAAHFGVRSLPTVKLFKDGQPVDEFTGALPEQSVREFLDKHLKDEIEAFLEQIDALIESGDTENAMAALNQAREQVPDNPKIVVRIARYKLDNEDIEGVVCHEIGHWYHSHNVLLSSISVVKFFLLILSIVDQTLTRNVKHGHLFQKGMSGF